MSSALLSRRFLSETARNPVALAILVVAPLVFVAVAGGAVADAGELLGGEGGPQAETSTAGWAAGFVAAIAMYFQIRSARAADRRLVLAGLAPARLVGARLTTGLVLAASASAVAVATLGVRNGIDHPSRVVAATVMFAVVYLAIGAIVGALVANPVNGTVLILFVWLLDVVFGPAFRPADTMISRALPTHYLALWMMDLPSHHGGRLGDLGWALAWTALALACSWIVILLTSRVAPTRTRPSSGTVLAELTTGVRMGVIEASRNQILWALLVAVPALFIAVSAVTTPSEHESMTVPEGGGRISVRVWFPDVHPGLMAPIAIGCLATLVGLFVINDARSGDRRLVLAGFRSGSLLVSRLAVITLLAMLATATSLAVTAAFFDARQWVPYIVANALVALTYALVGVLIGSLAGRVGGVLIAFLVPFLDLALEQSPMLNPQLSVLAHVLPGYGASRVLYDAALTPGFDESRALLVALAWLAGLAGVAVVVFRRIARADGSR